MTSLVHIEIYEKIEVFASIFQHIKNFSEMINIHFSEKELYIQSQDSSHISVFELRLPASWFSTYSVSKSVVLGVNSVILFSVLSSRDKKQKLVITHSSSDSDSLFLNFVNIEDKEVSVGGVSSSSLSKNFKIPLLDIECDVLAIPDVEHSAEFSISSVQFSILINQLRFFGESLDICCSEKEFILGSTCLDKGEMSVNVKIDDLTSFSINEGETLRLSFTLRLLHLICLFCKVSEEVEISITEGLPMKVVYQLGGDAKIVFYLAPMIRDDE